MVAVPVLIGKYLVVAELAVVATVVKMILGWNFAKMLAAKYHCKLGLGPCMALHRPRISQSHQQFYHACQSEGNESHRKCNPLKW